MISKLSNYTFNDMPETAEYFKEEEVCEVLTIPPEKPNIERILDVLVSPEIENIKLIQTEIGLSQEGQRLSGAKLVVEVRLKEKITYVADEPTQTVHAAHYETLKSMFIIVPQKINDVEVCKLIRTGKLNVVPYVEYVGARKLDCRRIHKCVLVFLDLKTC